MQTNNPPLETHPWSPYTPKGSRILIMGTFPPPESRWSMDFFYPNRTNDFWAVMGLIFFGDRSALSDSSRKGYNLDAIKNLLDERKIALGDTGYRIRRLAGNASDKFLEIVEPIDLYSVLSHIPECHNIATTGEKAASVIASITGTQIPKMGEMVSGPDSLSIWRMPSTSRAFPMKAEDKAEYYAKMFREAKIL